MKKTLASLFCAATLSLAPNIRAREAAGTQTNDSLDGRWTVTVDYHGTTVLFMLTLKQEGEKLTGDFDGDKLEGTQKGDAIQFLAKDDQGGSEGAKGVRKDDSIAGTVVFVNSDDPSHPETHAFTAKRVPPRPNVAPRRHEFVPTTFYRQFSGVNAPVLTVNPGDTIHTTTVDAGGTDEKGVTRVLGGNPETGPFYIESAAPGDTLIVHITRLKLNRDWAISDDYLVDRATDRDLAVKMKDTGKSVRWHLDLEKGVATSGKPGEHLAQYAVPLKPMTEAERLVADYAGTGLTIGRHPMALRRDELAMRGILRAGDLRTARPGRRVRVAGMVITRQRPGTAKGFVFLTLEDETGIANIIVRPDMFARYRLVILEEPFLIVDGMLQSQDGVTSVRAEEVMGLPGAPGSDVDFEAHDFY